MPMGTREETERQRQHKSGERNTMTMKERREESDDEERGESEEIMEAETRRPVGVMVKSRDGEQGQK